MRTRNASRGALAVLGLAFASAGAPARAEPEGGLDVDAACMASYTGAQRSRLHAQLRLARKQLLACLHPSCSQVLRKDCAAWLEEVEALVPSVVLSVKDPLGRPMTTVRVVVDGEIVAESISALPVGLDPGAHTLRFEAPGAVPVERPLVLRETQKAVPVEIVLEAEPPKAPSSDVVASPSARHFPAVALALGIGGAAALATGASFEVVGLERRASLDACRGRCSQGAVDDARSLVAVGDVATAVGLGALAGAAYLAFFRPRPQARGALHGAPASGGVKMEIVPLFGGLGVRAAF